MIKLVSKFMKPVAALEKVSRWQPNGDCEKYDGKTVEFLYDQGGRLMLLSGQIAVLLKPKFETVEIHYTGRLDPQDPPYSSYVFRVSQAHLRSAVPAARQGTKVDLFMEKPLQAPARVENRSAAFRRQERDDHQLA